MKGGIYSEQKCPTCQKSFQHFEPRGLWCPDHPQRQPTKYRVKFDKLKKRFKDYETAFRFLTGIRYETDHGKFDIRDHKRDNPLGFENQSIKWLAVKNQTVKSSTYRSIKRDIYKAIGAWQNANCKLIKYAEIEDFLLGLDVSSKTKANTRSVLHDFFTWLNKREGIPVPDMPVIKFELGWRNIIDVDVQEKIIAEVGRIAPVKVWVGIKWLSMYVAIRPNEMRNLKERDINVSGFFIVPTNKEKKPKLVPMLEDDIDLYNSFTTGLPDMFFFRHLKGNGTAKPGSHFGKDLFYKWWKRACKNLNIEGVDLYGGTRHSTTTAIGETVSREDLKEHGTMHSTNSAFERYMQTEKTKSLKVYQQIKELKEGKVVQFKNRVT